MRITTINTDEDIEKRIENYTQAIDNCLKWFQLHDIIAFEHDKAIYVVAGAESELEISPNEVFHRAYLYKSWEVKQ
tara:strand:- start:2970 stop:3197 length:228 start_codon:yes stop_codon:yes gene_type:complete